MYTYQQNYTSPNFMDIFSNFLTPKRIPMHIQQYMMKVYGTVAFTIVAAFIGCIVDMQYNLCGVIVRRLYASYFYCFIEKKYIYIYTDNNIRTCWNYVPITIHSYT